MLKTRVSFQLSEQPSRVFSSKFQKLPSIPQKKKIEQYNKLYFGISEEATESTPHHKPLQIISSLHYELNPISQAIIAKIASHIQKRTIKQEIQKFQENESNFQAKAKSTTVHKKINELRNINLKIASQTKLRKPRLKQTRSVNKGTISILQNSEDNRAALAKKTDFTFGSKLSQTEKNRDKIRLQMIHWLQENKNYALEALNDNKTIIQNWVNYVGYLAKQEFDHLLEQIGIRNDRTLYDRLFWLFDINGKNVIEASSIPIAFQLLKENIVFEVFFELCDEEGTGIIDEFKIYRFLQKNLNKENEKQQLRQNSFFNYFLLLNLIVRDLCRVLNPKNPKLITEDEVQSAALSNQFIKIIIEKNIQIIKQEKKVQKQIKQTHITSGQFENQTSAYYPYMDCLAQIVELKEKTYEQNSKRRQEFLKLMKFNKSMDNEDGNDTEEEQFFNF